KFERFIFDLLPLADRTLAYEIDEATNFAPLKNAPGASKDSPEHVQRQMMALYRKWLREVGAIVSDDTPVEISPLFALDVEQLREKIPAGTQVTQPTYFC